MKAKERIIISKNKKGRGYLYNLKCNYCSSIFKISGKKFNIGYGYYCSVSCANKGELRNYKKGLKTLKHGYIGVKTNDPRADKQGYYPEHRLIVEKKLGRKLLKKELIHHKNGIKNDNRFENLEVVSHSKHANIHCPKTGKNIKCNNCGKIVYKNKYVLEKFKNYYCSKPCYLKRKR